MLKAWLILIDTIVHVILVFSLSLYILYPPLQEKKEVFSYFDVNAGLQGYTSMYVHQFLKQIMEKMEKNQESPIEYVEEPDSVWEEEPLKENFIYVELEDRLQLFSAKIGDPIFIRIFKAESIMEIWIRTAGEYVHLKDYYIYAYSGVLGPKLKTGDMQAPEGFYRVKRHHLNPNSKYHLSFNLGFPNKYDRAHERTGSFLMVHGSFVSAGCYAMTDEKIEEIYALVEGALKKGQKYVQVHAYPFYMTEENMAKYDAHEWYDFWANLKEGYDYFEAEKLPPSIKVENKRYMILEANE